MSIIIAAAKLAAKYHAGQFRKNNGRPYLTHPTRVACRAMLLEDFTVDDVAGLFLHDVPEDCAPTSEDLMRIHAEIASACGGKTLAMVIGMTNMSSRLNPKLPRADRKRLDRERLKEQPRNVKRGKLLDRTENLRESIDDIIAGHDTSFKFNRLYADESELLLNEALLGADADLERELLAAIEDLRAICAKKTTNVVTET